MVKLDLTTRVGLFKDFTVSQVKEFFAKVLAGLKKLIWSERT